MSLSSIMQRDLGYNEAGKAEFHKKAKSALRKLAKKMNLKKEDFSIRSNLAGIACSGEVTLHHEKIYIQVSQSAMGQGREILYRRCNGQKDYSGQSNNFAPVSMLDKDLDYFAERLSIMIS